MELQDLVEDDSVEEDAIAAISMASRLGLPRRLVIILEGESLVNDATGLVTAWRSGVLAHA